MVCGGFHCCTAWETRSPTVQVVVRMSDLPMPLNLYLAAHNSRRHVHQMFALLHAVKRCGGFRQTARPQPPNHPLDAVSIQLIYHACRPFRMVRGLNGYWPASYASLDLPTSPNETTFPFLPSPPVPNQREDAVDLYGRPTAVHSISVYPSPIAYPPTFKYLDLESLLSLDA